jgi:ABC-2 type transport system ATP-binding protein
LDEPTAGVDVDLRKTLWQNLRSLNNQGVTIILTTHYLEEAEKMCDRIGILNRGELVALDTTENLLGRIQTKIVHFTTDKKSNITDNALESLKIILNNQNKLSVSYEKSKINIDMIVSMLKEQNIKIIDISTDDGDLEDIFLRLTKN